MTAPTRILLLTAVTHGHRTYGETLAAALAERSDAEVSHVRAARSTATKVLGARVPKLRGRDLSPIRRMLALDLQLRGTATRGLRDFDVVHVMPHGFAHAFARKASAPGSARLSVTLDSTAELMRSDFVSSALQARLRTRFDADILTAADHVVCLSEWVKASVLRYGVTDEAAIDIVPPSAPITGHVARHEGRTPVRIAFVGAPWRRKGGDRLLAWHQAHWRDRAELHVLCRDAPPEVASAEGVVVHEPITRTQVIEEFLPSCDLFVLPSRRDQSPWVLAEAAAAGLPTVTSGIAGLGELVLDQISGFTPGADDDRAFVTAITTLVDTPELRAAMGAAAADHARTHLDATANFARLAEHLVELGRRR